MNDLSDVNNSFFNLNDFLVLLFYDDEKFGGEKNCIMLTS